MKRELNHSMRNSASASGSGGIASMFSKINGNFNQSEALAPMEKVYHPILS